MKKSAIKKMLVKFDGTRFMKAVDEAFYANGFKVKADLSDWTELTQKLLLVISRALGTSPTSKINGVLMNTEDVAEVLNIKFYHKDELVGIFDKELSKISKIFALSLKRYGRPAGIFSVFNGCYICDGNKISVTVCPEFAFCIGNIPY